MEAHEQPTPEEARASLEQIIASRTAAAQATRRPAWIDAGISTAAGATIALGTAGYWVAAIVVLVVGSLVFAVVLHRQARGRGQVLDQRAIGARTLRFALLYAVLFVLGQIEAPPNWQPWYSLGAGLIAAMAGYAWLRFEDRYRVRRLTAGDYDRYDLI
ncbi:hypothetical protein H5399_02405 [Tessaracoccus sp. MC1627]|uniref:hypothetical protein n=1 Tax=Tessaracoccus sp. MC1627 TaxID=2760312 RepID=UPI001602E3B5|nr:hypothetical protein [Tessaracoccus sp. MC1627]MBB1511465.1 hypothetical protein [Tessaracoccus sp. MC1627]